ncbi:MAG: peptidylprolyl isomerase [Gammaproteobacteria bacterium]|nr:peptidylprolyl isomerase [Gammaproteobacteria bacterium]
MIRVCQPSRFPRCISRLRLSQCHSLIGGIFYAVQEMNVGGYRKVTIAPHLAYGETGIPDTIPPNAKLTVEIKVLEKM